MRCLLPAVALLAACPPPEPTEGELSVLTYNVQGLPDALSESDRPTADRMVDIAPRLDAFDLVGLQEDFDADWHGLLVAEATHPHQEWFDDTVDDRIYGAGLTELARGSVVSYEEHPYDLCNGTLDDGSDCLASKGFQATILDLGGATLAFLNTHHEAGGAEGDVVARESQIAQVIAWIDAHPEHAVLFVGDTNLRPSDVEDVAGLALYEAAGLRDACVEIGCAEPDHIDRFYLRDSAALALTVQDWEREVDFVGADGTDLSDHPALSAVVRWVADAP
jgi:hypothetical protein